MFELTLDGLAEAVPAEQLLARADAGGEPLGEIVAVEAQDRVAEGADVVEALLEGVAPGGQRARVVGGVEGPLDDLQSGLRGRSC